MIFLYFLSGCLVTFIIVCLIGYRKIIKDDKLLSAMKKSTESISEDLIRNNLVFDKLHDKVNKKSMEKQLRIKLDMEDELNMVDKETLKKIKEI